MFREDYLMRMIQQLADFISHVAGLNQQGEHDKALAEADQAWGKLLDAPRALIDAVDTPTLAGMLREPAKIRAAARLCFEEARALAAKGDPPRAQLRYRRALELLLEVRALDPHASTSQDEALLGELSGIVPADTVDPRYRPRDEARVTAAG